MGDVQDLIAQIATPNTDFTALAQKILAICPKLDPKLGKPLQQAAQEVLHYANQIASAETEQWRQSFYFEMLQSVANAKKILKKIR
jgi:hypothetical protein